MSGKNTDLQCNRSNLMPNSPTPLYRAVIVKIITSVLAAILNVYFVTKSNIHSIFTKYSFQKWTSMQSLQPYVMTACSIS